MFDTILVSISSAAPVVIAGAAGKRARLVAEFGDHRLLTFAWFERAFGGGRDCAAVEADYGRIFGAIGHVRYKGAICRVAQSELERFGIAEHKPLSDAQLIGAITELTDLMHRAAYEGKDAAEIYLPYENERFWKHGL